MNNIYHFRLPNLDQVYNHNYRIVCNWFEPRLNYKGHQDRKLNCQIWIENDQIEFIFQNILYGMFSLVDVRDIVLSEDLPDLQQLQWKRQVADYGL